MNQTYNTSFAVVILVQFVLGMVYLCVQWRAIKARGTQRAAILGAAVMTAVAMMSAGCLAAPVFWPNWGEFLFRAALFLLALSGLLAGLIHIKRNGLKAVSVLVLLASGVVLIYGIAQTLP